MRFFDLLKEKKKKKEELAGFEYSNARYRADLDIAIQIVLIGESSVESLYVRAKHARFRARLEAIRDRTDQLEIAIKKKDVDTARALNNVICAAIFQLNTV